MQRQYETVIIFTPVLSDSEIKKALEGYKKSLTDQGTTVVAEDHWGLRQLAYPIRKKTTGIYHILQHESNPDSIAKLEVDFKRDESIMRFLTVSLDKFAVDYYDKKRKGLIGKKKPAAVEAEGEETSKAK